MTLVWNVFRCNITRGDKIETINIFQHRKFTNEIIDIYITNIKKTSLSLRKKSKNSCSIILPLSMNMKC